MAIVRWLVRASALVVLLLIMVVSADCAAEPSSPEPARPRCRSTPTALRAGLLSSAGQTGPGHRSQQDPRCAGYRRFALGPDRALVPAGFRYGCAVRRMDSRNDEAALAAGTGLLRHPHRHPCPGQSAARRHRARGQPAITASVCRAGRAGSATRAKAWPFRSSSACRLLCSSTGSSANRLAATGCGFG